MNSGSNKKSFFLGMLVSFVITSFIFLVAVSVLLVSLLTLKEEGGGALFASGSSFTQEELEKLSHYKEKIKESYYEDVDDETILDGMLSGMMLSVGDPYTCYYTKAEMEDMAESMSGTFQGIGAYLQADTEVGYAKIAGVMKGSPASEAGVQEEDYIVLVEGEDMFQKDLNYIASKVRGPEGTTVTLTLNRKGEKVELEVERREIKTESVTYELVEGNIAYVRIAEFSDVTSEQFAQALEQFEKDGAEGMLIDLRGNPGGNLTAVVEVCDQILPRGLIVYTEDKYGEGKRYSSSGGNEFKKPLVVLIDGASASASEIMAGAIKDYGIGELVGTNTFGKGIVQTVFQYSDGSGGKLTVSKYFTPNGVNIHKVGIAPDVEIPFDSEAYLEDETDNQYNEAIRILQEKIK